IAAPPVDADRFVTGERRGLDCLVHLLLYRPQFSPAYGGAWLLTACGYDRPPVYRSQPVPQRVCKSYKVLVGMEIHVQLATQSKMFTGAANGFGGEPNSQVDEQVLGLPGTLPVMNRKAVEYAIKVGLALGCQIAKHTKWDRKSYYYPDLPKNYQISQYDLPLCSAGEFVIPGEDGQPKKIRIRRAHLEEDAGKLLHEAPGGYKIGH